MTEFGFKGMAYGECIQSEKLMKKPRVVYIFWFFKRRTV